jgi:hypothetical protein
MQWPNRQNDGECSARTVLQKHPTTILLQMGANPSVRVYQKAADQETGAMGRDIPWVRHTVVDRTSHHSTPIN